MKILEDSIIVDGHVLHRIQADRDIPFHGVKVGDIGGWVEKPNNLQDDAWVTGYLYGDAVADGNALARYLVMLTFRRTQGLVSMPRFSTMQILVVMHGLVVML